MLTEQLDWEKTDGMMPAIVQHAVSGEVLMHGYMDEISKLTKKKSEYLPGAGENRSHRQGYLLLAHQAAAVDQG